MNTTAYMFLSACMAGLKLWGVDEYKQPEWVGTLEEFRLAKHFEKLYEEGLLPNNF